MNRIALAYILILSFLLSANAEAKSKKRIKRAPAQEIEHDYSDEIDELDFESEEVTEPEKPAPAKPQPAKPAAEPTSSSTTAPEAAQPDTVAPAPEPSPAETAPPVAAPEEPATEPPVVAPAETPPAPVVAEPKPKVAKKKKRKKKIAKKAPPKSRTVYGKSTNSLRFLRDTREFGQIQVVSTFPSIYDFSFFVNSTFNSQQNVSRSEADMSKYSFTVYMYSPHIYKNFGVVGMYTDNSGGFNQAVRMGLYYKFNYNYGNMSIGLTPMIWPADEGVESDGRFTSFYGVEFYKKFGIGGHFHINKLGHKSTNNSGPMAYVELKPGLKLNLIYDYNTAFTRDAQGWQFGIQFGFRGF